MSASAPTATSHDTAAVREAIEQLRHELGGAVSAVPGSANLSTPSAPVTAVDTGTRRRAEYSTDASNYRVVPEAIVFPRDVDELIAATAIVRSADVPLTLRGGGTSMAGNAIGPGIVIDTSRHLNRLVELDPEARTARVEPGLNLGDLQQASAPHGLRFGPDPSSWARCTLGGMIGNNACGSHSLIFGRTADNIIDLDIVDGTGCRRTVSQGFDDVPELEQLVKAHLADIRTEFGRFGRHISGYSLEHLLPENRRNLAAALVGTEGTCMTVLGATVRLVERPIDPVLVVLAYPDMARAADAVPAVLEHRPGAVEGLDSRIVAAVREHKGAAAAEALPEGGGWLFVEIAGADQGETRARAEALAGSVGATSTRILTDPADIRAVQRIREDGAGLAGRTPSGTQAWPGLEDAAVPPDNLGAYLREFDGLLDDYGITGMPYGHFGDGCVHVRLDIPLERDGSVLRSFMSDAADLIVAHDGSLSGEHGDGRARGALLERMYSTQAVDAMRQFKGIFDPRNLLNPGVIVDPAPLDRNLRRPHAAPLPAAGGFSFGDDGGDFTKAVHRCVGIGKCRADNTASGGFMCPSYIATRDEKDSTRGRARVLQEMANGSLVDRDWRSPEVHDVLDLCLSCKACSTECPAGVDMATYKSEVLHRTYRHRLRPLTHYVLGWLPRWARLASPFARLINAATSVRPLEKLVLRLGGMDARRRAPAFAVRPWRRSRSRSERRAATRRASAIGDEGRAERRATASGSEGARESARGDGGAGERAQASAGQGTGATTGRPRIAVWVDSFSDNFSPSIAHATIEVLDAAGYDVVFPPTACCGLTWITTGQLDAAKRKLRGLMDAFGPLIDAGVPIVGLEPSCTAVLRSDLVELFPGDERAAAIAENTLTVSELLTTAGELAPRWPDGQPDLTGVDALVQPHCHQHSVMGFAADRALLTRLGATVSEISGCCGLAGNFGMERGHYEVSVAVAENALLPALRDAAEGTVFLADGFSCRTQAEQLAGAHGIHLAELLASRL